jgi:chemotaxis receptor (MCP) glutamine deamidase CheD
MPHSHSSAHRYHRALPFHKSHPAALHDPHEPRKNVGIGEVAASNRPLRLETVLGSCVAVCLFDPVARVGGMNHILVPSSSSNYSARCGVHAMELLINALMKHGADRRRIVAKAFGAGNVLPIARTPSVGELNAKFVREFLHTEKISLLAERMGGDQAVRVIFHAHTGRAFVHTVDGSSLPRLIREETSWYNTEPVRHFLDEEPTIF